MIDWNKKAAVSEVCSLDSLCTCISSTPSSFSLFSAERFLSDSSRESRPESVSASRTGWWLEEEEVGVVVVCTLVLGDSRDRSQLSGCSCSSGLQSSSLSL